MGLPLLFTWCATGVLFLLALRHHARRQAVLGPVVTVERAPRTAAVVGTLVGLSAAVWAWRVDAGLLTGEVLPSLALLVPALWLPPRGSDRALGERGVQSGWRVVPLGELLEWRLTGDHLRFRLGATWEAVPLEPALHPDVRARLTEAAPGAESPWR